MSLIFNWCLHLLSCFFVALFFLIVYSLLPHLFLRNILSFLLLFYQLKRVTGFVVVMINSKLKFILCRSSPPLYITIIVIIIIYLFFLISIFISHRDLTIFNLTFIRGLHHFSQQSMFLDSIFIMSL
jgi:hypothetical protein